ncbi:MAG TPA: 50S ribosomal protein L4 [Candidatus Nanoarchaeia archaeon]|nr:50S ribosomal protein L4 [Candidatus Nanoarchaeia archaeon]
MKVQILDTANTKVGDIELPSQFNEAVRDEIILRAVLAIQSHGRQPYAAHDTAGKRSSAKLSRRRKNYRGSYGIGISRVPRKIMTRRGTRLNWVGAFAPGTVGGRRAHPPKTSKIWGKKINEKERRKAIRSAISATMLKDVVTNRGHNVPNNFPFIIDSKFESVAKTAEAEEILQKLGFTEELERSSEKKVRVGKGKARDRKYKKKKGILVVAVNTVNLMKSLSNIPGIDVVEVKNINAELLAPGGKPGRLTLWTKDAIEYMKKEKSFT